MNIVHNFKDHIYGFKMTPTVWFNIAFFLSLFGLALASSFPRLTCRTLHRSSHSLPSYPLFGTYDVTLDQELTFTHHVIMLYHDCYYQLHQRRVAFCSLTSNTALVHIHSIDVFLQGQNKGKQKM